MKFKKDNSVRLPKAPRAMEDIQKDFGPAVQQAGQLQYQIAIFQEELKTINKRLKELSLEASARAAIDNPKAAPAPSTEEGVV